MLRLQPYGATDPGKVRKNNEDALLVGEGRDETLFIVADGIGGFEAGEVASSIAIDALKDVEPAAPLESAIKEANRRILAAARGDEKLAGMGTTVVALRFRQEEPVAEIFHVGDSRAYLLRGGDLRQITEDHSLVAELVRSGDLTRAQASEHPQKNLITRALGAEEEVNVDKTVLPVEPGDRLMLCSDGLSDMVPEVRMRELLTSSGAEDPGRAARALVSAALDAGGLDNVTVVVVDVKEEDLPADEPRRGDTREMSPVLPEETGAPRRRERLQDRRRTRGKHAASRAKGGTLGRASGALVRALAAVLVLVVLASPFVYWGATRYFLDFDGDEVVVVYQGLPSNYTLGLDLSKQVRPTGLTESEIDPKYLPPIYQHDLYPNETKVGEFVCQRYQDRISKDRSYQPDPGDLKYFGCGDLRPDTETRGGAGAAVSGT